jgi:hypothetical protein
METIRIRDPGWKTVGSGIRDTHPGSPTLMYTLVHIFGWSEGLLVRTWISAVSLISYENKQIWQIFCIKFVKYVNYLYCVKIFLRHIRFCEHEKETFISINIPRRE